MASTLPRQFPSSLWPRPHNRAWRLSTGLASFPPCQRKGHSLGAPQEYLFVTGGNSTCLILSLHPSPGLRSGCAHIASSTRILCSGHFEPLTPYTVSFHVSLRLCVLLPPSPNLLDNSRSASKLILVTLLLQSLSQVSFMSLT